MTSPIRPLGTSWWGRLRALRRRWSPRRVGVRTRILLTFVVGALVLSGVLFFLTYTLTRSNLRDREGELGLSNQLIAETLASVRASLILATVITVLVGFMLGIVSSERVVRPLAGAAEAARAIADGRLDTRLEPTDDPDLNALTDSFNAMVARLQDRVERDARFASDVSHELRSPLMTLAASVEVMVSRRDELPERGQAALDLLVADVARFSGLVEDLLEISRYDAGAVRLTRDELQIGEFVRQAVLASSMPRTAISINERCSDIRIHGDRRRLARVVANLIDNARTHGGGTISVHVCPAEDSASHVWIVVEDRGEGVSTTDRERIFERFSRGAGSSKRGTSEGAGLGLALVREHVRLHAGRVWVEPRHDGTTGARFVVELPCESARSPQSHVVTPVSS
ncbi:MAG: ATP-binding protein [Ilumatobacteraceae bacterium]